MLRQGAGLLGLCLQYALVDSATPIVDIHAWGTYRGTVNSTAMVHVGSQEFTVPFASSVFPSSNVGVLVSVVAPKVTDHGLYYVVTTRAINAAGFNILLACNSLDAVVDGTELEFGWFAFHIEDNPLGERSDSTALQGGSVRRSISDSTYSANATYVADVSYDVGYSLSSDSKSATITTTTVNPSKKPLVGILATATAPDVVETFSVTLTGQDTEAGTFGVYVTRVDLLAEDHWYQNVGLSWLGWESGPHPTLENTTFGTATVSVQSCAALLNLPNGCYCTHKFECASGNCDSTSHCVAAAATSSLDSAASGSQTEWPGFDATETEGSEYPLQLSATTHSIDISHANFTEPPMVLVTVAESPSPSPSAQNEQILSVIRSVTPTAFVIDVIAYTDEWLQDSYDVEVAYSLHSKKYSCNFSCEMGSLCGLCLRVHANICFFRSWMTRSALPLQGYVSTPNVSVIVVGMALPAAVARKASGVHHARIVRIVAADIVMMASVGPDHVSVQMARPAPRVPHACRGTLGRTASSVLHVPQSPMHSANGLSPPTRAIAIAPRPCTMPPQIVQRVFKVTSVGTARG